MNPMRIVYFPAIIVLILSIVGGFIVERELSQWSRAYAKDELTEVAQVSVDILKDKTSLLDVSSNEISDWDFVIDELPTADARQRISLISADGKVLGDSKLTESEIAALDNHANRPEIAAAISKGLGHSIRYSDTLRTNLLYVAVNFEHHELRGVLRVASPENQGDFLIRDVKFIVLSTAGAGMLLIVAILVFVARYIALFIKQQQYKQGQVIESRTREIELLGKFASLMAACNTLDEAGKVVSDLAPRIVGPINGAVALLRSSRNQLEVKFDWGETWQGAKIYGPDDCWALRKGKFHFESDSYSNLPCAHSIKETQGNSLCVPLVAHGNTIGIIHWQIEEELSDEKMQLISAIAEHLGMALANLALQEKLRNQAFRDPLTGLYNRRYFMDSLENLMMTCARDGKTFSLLMLDLDHFKRFNDNFGHDAGDYVLKSLANSLSNVIRTDDIVCRLGGEEFAVILPETDTENAMLIAEKLNELVRNLHLEFNNNALGRLTLSAGIANYSSDILKVQTLIKNADIALYQAKEGGRDQYCVYGAIEDERKGAI